MGRVLCAAMDTQQQGNMAAGGQLGMGDIEGGGKQGRKQQKQTQPAAKPPKRAWASVTVEEPIDTKVKRVKQVRDFCSSVAPVALDDANILHDDITSGPGADYTTNAGRNQVLQAEADSAAEK